MGFGEKTDYQSNPQRVLNLDRTFEDVIEPTVTAAGLNCIRADRIIHSTVIDKPMYEHLLDADLVIADLSTSNPNAIYELGVRHALRPHATIVIAEEQFAFPFDLNHVSIARYEHLGREIGFREVMRLREVLQNKIAGVLAKAETDSPVFLFLPQLMATGSGSVPSAAPTAHQTDDRSFAELFKSFKDAKKAVKVPIDWLLVVERLRRLQKLQPNDPYIIQQLARATYKSRHPNAISALHDARVILERLKPETSSDAITVGIWGTIHQSLWEAGGETDLGDLDNAIRAHARGYFMKSDYYNGINFAFLLNARALTLEGEEATADRVFARRVRTEVLTLCDAALGADSETAEPMVSKTLSADDKFWISSAKVQALFGLGRTVEAQALRENILGEMPPPPQWMVQSMDDHLARLGRKLQPPSDADR
jgi:hypothetical protein